MKTIKEELKRRTFTGKLSGFISKIERNGQKKALNAYLAGKNYYIFGTNSITGKPNIIPVPEKWMTESQYQAFLKSQKS